MSEHKPKIEMSQELADSSKEPTFDKENEDKEKEYKWVTPAEVRTKLSDISRDKYLELYHIMESSFNEKKLTKEQYNQTIEKIDELSKKELGYKITEKYPSKEKAKEILGKDYLGPEEVEKAFGVKLEANDIPLILFDVKELERAKELNQMLILRTNKASDGSPLTMQKINDSIKPSDDGKILHYTGWYKEEEFYTKEAPNTHWALVSKEEISNSTDKDYWQQTETIISYIEKDIFKEESLPEEYQKAIKEFNSYKEENFKDLSDDEINELLSGPDWQKYAQEISSLKINQLFRQSPVEAIYDWTIKLQNSKDRLMAKNMYTWTNSRALGGGLVSVGDFGTDGAGVNEDGPDYSNDNIGVCFSRSH